jgi:hypothetical protein
MDQMRESLLVVRAQVGESQVRRIREGPFAKAEMLKVHR